MSVKNFGDLEPGEFIVGSDGEPVMVTRVYDEHEPETMWEIELEDGRSIKASGNHLWYVETLHDYSLHAQRRKVGKKFFSELPKETLDLLLNLANSPDEVETSLIDVITLVQAVRDPLCVRAVERVAESIGHVAENSQVYEDMDTGEVVERTTVRTYDARRFAQQILSLSGDRKYKKKWPLISGKVITTLELLELDEVDIPVLDSIGAPDEPQ